MFLNFENYNNNMFDVPDFGLPKKKSKTLEELRNERQRLVELDRIRKLKLRQQEYDLKANKQLDFERQQKIAALKQIGGGIMNVVKAGHNKISAFEKSRLNAKPIIPSIPKKRKSIYD